MTYAAPHRKRSNYRPELLPFIVRIVSESKRTYMPKMKRVQAIVRVLGVTTTMHLDVPRDFTV